MKDLLTLALAFPTVVYTVPLGVVLVYWLFVVLGAMHIDVLGGGHDGLLAGGHDGVIEGVAKGAAEGGADHLAAHIPEDGGFAGFIGALRLRSAPATVVLSLLITFSWLGCVLGVQAARELFPHANNTMLGIALMILSMAIALPITSIAIRPLARLFVPLVAKGREDLVGKICAIRTGTVDDSFGEATVEDGGAGVIVRVRVDGGNALRRGDSALIIGWDEAKQSFMVAPMDEVMVNSTKPTEAKKSD